jgi:hypothetical protein
VAIRRTVCNGAYRSFESRPSNRTFRQAFTGPTGDRVLELHNRFDPDGVFRRLAIDNDKADRTPADAFEESR